MVTKTTIGDGYESNSAGNGHTGGSSLLSVCSAGETIYDSTRGWSGGYGLTALEEGDEVQAAGSERLVTRLTIGVYRQFQPGVASFQARLYANDGTSGQPKTMLWQSAVLAGVQLSGDVQFIPFDVPQVLVPDTFTWTLQVLQNSPGNGVALVDTSSPSYRGQPELRLVWELKRLDKAPILELDGPCGGGAGTLVFHVAARRLGELLSKLGMPRRDQST